MDRKRLLILYLLYRRRKYKKPSARKFWVQPMLSERDRSGVFNTLFPELCNDKKRFFDYFHMSLGTFNFILSKLEPHITRRDTSMRKAIKPAEKLAVTLRYLATGSSFTKLHYTFCLGISTISCIVREVCCQIWKCFQEEFMPFPSKEIWRSVTENFERRVNFPNCIGAVSGKFIKVKRPENNNLVSPQHKDYFSLVLLAIADPNYKLIYIDVGAFGKDCDTSILKETTFWNLLRKDALNIPNKSNSSDGMLRSLPYILAGDEAFTLATHLMRPFSGNKLSPHKKILNYHLNRARRYVESTISILSNKWGVLHHSLHVPADYGIDVLKACCILHNIVLEKDGYQFEDTLEIIGLDDIPHCRSGTRGGHSANEIRDRFGHYFLTDSSNLSEQLSKI